MWYRALGFHKKPTLLGIQNQEFLSQVPTLPSRASTHCVARGFELLPDGPVRQELKAYEPSAAKTLNCCGLSSTVCVRLSFFLWVVFWSPQLPGLGLRVQV